MNELARAKSMLDLYRAQLSAEQYALLTSKLAQTEQAYVELTTLTEVGAQAAVAETGASAAAATGGRALLGSGAAGSLGQRQTHGECRRDCKALGAYRYKCGDGKVWDL